MTTDDLLRRYPKLGDAIYPLIAFAKASGGVQALEAWDLMRTFDVEPSESIRLSREDAEFLVDALTNPRPPADALVRAFRLRRILLDGPWEKNHG